MGSGCTNKSTNVGKCLDKDIVSSYCVNWQGKPFETLGVCTGDNLTEVGETILNELVKLEQGEGITIDDILAGCADLDLKIQNSDKSLKSFIKILLEQGCSFETAISQVTVQLNEAFQVDTKCIGEVTSKQDFNQKVVDKLCDMQNQLTILQESFQEQEGEQSEILTTIKEIIGDSILNKITNCNGAIVKNGSGDTATLEFRGMIPIGGRIYGDFDLTKFDNTGKGVDIYCGYALCNGKNGTVDMRDFVPAMATNIPGVTRLFDHTTNVGDNLGSNSVTLTIAQIPSHNHIINVTNGPVSMTYREFSTTASTGTEYPLEGVDQRGSIKFRKDNVSVTGTTNVSATSSNVGNGQSHSNIQPTHYGVWIQRIN